MKIFNFIGRWVDKLETLIFGGEGYQPLAGKGFMQVLAVGIGVGICVFIAQMVNRGGSAQDWVAGIGGVAMLATMVRAVLPNFLNGTGTILGKIGYGVFCFVLVVIALQLSMWIVMLLIALLVIYIMLFFLGGSTGPTKKGWVKIKHADGSTEDRKIESGLMGERTVTDKYRNTWEVPYGKNYLEVNP